MNTSIRYGNCTEYDSDVYLDDYTIEEIEFLKIRERKKAEKALKKILEFYK